MKPFAGFQHVETHHCVTGSLHHLYLYYDHTLSEDMLLGLGEGVGFVYWQQKGQPPFIGGRATPEPSLEELAGLRTGVQVTPICTSSGRKAEAALLERLEKDVPVMLQVDMGFLPYFDFKGTEYHFGGHVVVVCGYDAARRQVLIADRDADLHPVSLDDLAKARGSNFKPFPPHYKLYAVDFTHKRMPIADEINTAIRNQCERMLHPPISNLGLKGIRKAAQLLPAWQDNMSAEELKWALFNAYIFISPVGGTGGGTFRYMFSRFLAEAAALTDNPALTVCAEQFRAIGDAWEKIGVWCKAMSESSAPDLREGRTALLHVADLENAAWAHLYSVLPAHEAMVTP